MDITLYMTDGESITVSPENPANALRALELMLERQSGVYTINCGADAPHPKVTVAGAHIVRIGHSETGSRDLFYGR